MTPARCVCEIKALMAGWGTVGAHLIRSRSRRRFGMLLMARGGNWRLAFAARRLLRTSSSRHSSCSNQGGTCRNNSHTVLALWWEMLQQVRCVHLAPGLIVRTVFFRVACHR